MVEFNSVLISGQWIMQILKVSKTFLFATRAFLNLFLVAGV